MSRVYMFNPLTTPRPVPQPQKIFVNGDSAGSLGGTLSFTTAATASSGVGGRQLCRTEVDAKGRHPNAAVPFAEHGERSAQR